MFARCCGPEIGIAYTRADGGPELARNPNGLVPVIVDGDFVLWESNSVIRYLVNNWAAGALLPCEPQARAKVDRWIDWQATELNNSWRYAFSAIVRRNPAFDDAGQPEASKKAGTDMIAILDAQLFRTGAYVAGTAFTLADSDRALGQSLVHDAHGASGVRRRGGVLWTPEHATRLPEARPQRDRVGARPKNLINGRISKRLEE